MRSQSIGFVLLAVSFLLTASIAAIAAEEQEWGDLTGEFIYDGVPPNPMMINIRGLPPIADESLVVDKKTGAIANIVASLQTTASQPVRPIHPDFEKAVEENPDVILNVLAAGFEPHVLLKRSTQSIAAKNKAGVGVDVKLDPIKNLGQAETIPAGESAWLNLPLAETLPCKVSSRTDPWMGAYVVVKDHPYMAVSDTNGRFEIKNLPVGKWTFRFWHERKGYLRAVKRDGKQVTWEKGLLEVDIRPGTNDLGRILVPEVQFKR